MYRWRRGMGAIPTPGSSLIDTGFGIKVDCSQLGPWLLNSGCWSYSPATWAQMAQLPEPPAPPAYPAVGAGTSLVPAPYKCADGSMATSATNCPEYSGAIDAATAAQSAAQKAGALAFFQSLPDNPAGPPQPCNALQSMTTDADGNPVCSDSWWVWPAGILLLAAGLMSPWRKER